MHRLGVHLSSCVDDSPLMPVCVGVPGSRRRGRVALLRAALVGPSCSCPHTCLPPTLPPGGVQRVPAGHPGRQGRGPPAHCQHLHQHAEAAGLQEERDPA